MASALVPALDLVWGYSGGAVTALGGASFAYPCASGMAINNGVGREQGASQHWLPSGTDDANRRVGAVAVNSACTMMIVSDRRLQANMTVFSLPDRRVVQRVEHVAKLGVCDMAFSRDGTTLAVLSDAPRHNLTVYSVDPHTMRLNLLYSQRDTANEHQYQHVSVNPRNTHEFCTSGGGHVAFWRLDTRSEPMQLTSIDGRVTAPNVRLTTHQYLTDGTVAVGTRTGEIFSFDFTTGVGNHLSDLGDGRPIVAMMLSVHHVVTLSDDGTVRFLSPDATRVTKTAQTGIAEASSFTFTAEWHTIVIGGGCGTVAALQIPGYDSPALSAEEFNLLTPRLVAVVDAPAGPVVGATLVGDDVLATVATTGVLRVLDHKKNRLEARLHIGDGPLAVADVRDDVLAVGYSTGTLRFIKLMNRTSPSITSQQRITPNGQPIEAVFCNERMVIAVSGLTLYFVDSASMALTAHVTLPEASEGVQSVAFLPRKNDRILISTKNSALVLMKVPDETSARAPEAAEDAPLAERLSSKLGAAFDPLYVNTWRCDMPLLRIAVLAVYEDSLNVVGATLDREVKFFTTDVKLPPTRRDREYKSLKMPITFKDHEKKITHLSILEGRWMLSAGSDGKIALRDLAALVTQTPNLQDTKKDQVGLTCRHVSAAGGIESVAFGQNQRLVTCGGDGAVIMWRTALHGGRPAVAGAERPAFNIPTALPPVVPCGEERYYFLEQRQRNDDEADRAAHAGHRSELIDRVVELRGRLRTIRDENERVAEDEHVEDEEFLPERERELFQQNVSKSIDAMRDEVRWTNLRCDYVTDKLKRECWDVMQTKLTPLHAMNTPNLTVYNLHQRTTETKHMTLLRKLKFLRKVEEVERSARSVHELDDVKSSGKMDDEGRPLPNDPYVSPLLDMKTDFDQKPPALEVEAVQDVTPFLYRPMLAFTRARAITQIMLLTARSTNIAREFNGKFTALVQTKEHEVAKIRERNARSILVQKELEDKRQLFQAGFREDEKPESLLIVKDEEVPADKSHDPDEVRRVAAEEAEKERWRRTHGNDDSSERALKAWMDGRLDKEIKTLQVRIEKPAFAVEGGPDFKDPDERTDEQNKIYREYEKELAKKTQEVESRRKVLQTELDMLQKDNLESAKKFDTQLNALLLDRLIAVQRSSEVDLQRVKLAQGIIAHADRDVVLGKLEKSRVLLSNKLIRASIATQRYKKDVEAKKEQLVQLQADEKAKEKGMRGLPPFNEAEEHAERLFKVYVNAKRKPKRDRGRGEKTKKPKVDHGPAAVPTMDPFAFIDREEEAKKKAIAEELQAATTQLGRLEKPEGIPDLLWDAFLVYVQERADGERAVKRLQDELAEMLKEEQRLIETEDELRRVTQERTVELVQFRADCRRELYDVDELRLFRQGQVEVDQAPVVTDYADSLLIHSQVIEDLNKDIKSRGQRKVTVMKEMANKRRDMRYVDWEIEKYAYQVETLSIEAKHLQTLRVTKRMQEFINSSGAEGHNEHQREKLHEKIEHVRTTMAAKIEEKKLLMAKIKRSTREREMENQLLLDQVGEAHNLVESRRSIRDLQSSELERERNNKLMRDMRVTRKLEDVAKAQQEEMATLKKEIDRLRERTFPSFAVVSKRVIGNPDEV